MTDTYIIGMVVIALSTLITLFTAVYKPLSENTKAMATLSVRLEELTKQMDKHDKELEEYKEHVSEGQRKQWDTINQHTKEIEQLKGGFKK